ncbi:MAG: hypothetical protein EA001_07210 [Oscillatoriales cyanobacterium]|nr:MAG: hypothetical protein EA001_07210 [Oscillatoriales cyanobacterium]
MSVVNYAIGLLIAWLRRLVYHPSVPPFFGQVFDVFDPYVTSFILIAILVTINSAFLQRLGMRLGIRKSVVISIHIWGFALAWLANQIGDYQAWFAVQPPTAPSTLKDPWAWWSSTGGKEVVAWYSRRERELITTPLWVTRPLQLVISSAVIGFIIADDD